jgi:hypothetical protein
MRFLAVTAIAVLWLMGCGSKSADLTASKRFDRYELYYLGRSFAGLPLTDAGAGEFIYGDCDPGDDEGCAPPIEIQNYSACERNLSSYTGQGSGPEKRLRVRGVPAAVFEDGGRIEVYTGRTTVVIFSDEATLRAAEALRPIRGKGPTVKLPPPAPGALEGKARC